METSRSSGLLRRIGLPPIDRHRVAVWFVALTLACSGCGAREALDIAAGPGNGGQGGGSATGGTAMPGGAAAIGGSNGSSGMGGSSGGGGSSGSGGGAGGPPVVCPATCSSGAGSLFYVGSAAQLNDALVGRWRICSDVASVFLSKPSDTIGVEFLPRTPSDPSVEGVLQYLVAGPNGAVPGTGSSYQAKYRIEFEQGIAGVFVNNVGFYLRYSPCPEQIQFAKMNVEPVRTLIAGMD